MSNLPSISDFRLKNVRILEGLIDPSIGVAAPVGSTYLRHGATTTINLKTGVGDSSWFEHGISGLGVFNVRKYGAVGDGVTDDTAAIMVAIIAANAAGGGMVYFPTGNYLITKNAIVGSDYVSFDLGNMQCLSFMGDGASSQLIFSDTTNNTLWYGFYIHNGASNIKFTDLAFDGKNMIAGSNDTACIGVVGESTDANVGTGNVLITNCVLGPARLHAVHVKGVDDAHRVNNVRIVDCVCDGSFSSGSLVVMQAYLNHIQIQGNSVFGGQGQVANSTLFVVTNQAVTEDTKVWDWNLDHNHFSRTDVPISSPSDMCAVYGAGVRYNTFQSGGTRPLFTGANLAHRTVRGNVAVKTNNSLNSNVFGVTVMGGDPAECFMRGNVLVCTDSTGGTGAGVSMAASTSANAQQMMVACDNIIEMGGPGAANCITFTNMGNAAAVCDGNILVLTNCQSGSGSHISFSTQNNSPISQVIGNLCISTGQASLNCGQPINAHANAGSNTSLSEISYNMIVGGRSAVNYGSGTPIQWRGTMLNSQTRDVNNTSFATFAPGGVGITGMGNTPGPQIVFSNAGTLANIAAPKGSLCAQTSALPTTIAYKETDDGTAGGGASGWLGIGGKTLTFGVQNGTTATATRFLAMGMGLVTEGTIEIQYAVVRPCIIRNLRVRCVAGTGSGTCTYFIRKNGVNTPGVAMNNVAANGSNTTSTFTCVPGDLLSFAVNKAGTITTPQTNIAVSFELV